MQDVAFFNFWAYLRYGPSRWGIISISSVAAMNQRKSWWLPKSSWKIPIRIKPKRFGSVSCIAESWVSEELSTLDLLYRLKRFWVTWGGRKRRKSEYTPKERGLQLEGDEKTSQNAVSLHSNCFSEVSSTANNKENLLKIETSNLMV